MRSIRIPERSLGVTVIDLVLTVALIAVLAAAVPQLVAPAQNSFRVTQTLAKLRRIRNAMVGDADKLQNGVRTDFGFLGDLLSLIHI